MSSPASYRNRQIYVTQAQYEALQALAAVSGDDCADACAERLLGAALSEHAQLGWLVERRKAVREQVRDEYHERLRAATNRAEAQQQA